MAKAAKKKSAKRKLTIKKESLKDLTARRPVKGGVSGACAVAQTGACVTPAVRRISAAEPISY